MADEIDAILAATTAALSPSPDISGCPDDIAMLAAAAVLRASAEWVEDITTYRDLRRWADAIDDRATGSESGTHWGARLAREAMDRAEPDTAPDGGSASARVPSRVQARDEPCADPANCDVHQATTAPSPSAVDHG